MNNFIEIKNLSKTYHSKIGEVKALDNINITIKDKEFLSIIGPSGCGKSTILNLISGLEKYDGFIKYNKELVIGYMLQSDSLFPWLTILDNALIGLKVKKSLTKENVEYTKNLLIKYGLKDFLDKYPSSLSGGMRQRVLRM